MLKTVVVLNIFVETVMHLLDLLLKQKVPNINYVKYMIFLLSFLINIMHP